MAILVVDDNAEAAEVLGIGLELLGQEVRTALDGESALAMLDEWRPAIAIEDGAVELMLDRWGADALPQHYQAFDTICSATQDRQDAVVALLKDRTVDVRLSTLPSPIPLVLMVRVTNSLALPASASAGDIVWRMALCGAGFGMFQSPNNRAMITAAPKSRSGGASRAPI